MIRAFATHYLLVIMLDSSFRFVLFRVLALFVYHVLGCSDTHAHSKRSEESNVNES
jgi:hypothetical protein